MEFRLKFKEKEIKDIYDDSFKTWNNEFQKEIKDIYDDSFKTWNNEFQSELKEKRITIIVLLLLTILTMSLIFVHFDWIYYGFFFLLITIAYYIRARRQRQKVNKEIKKWKNDLADFFIKYKNINEIRYLYDYDKIQYFEQGNLTQEILWKDLQQIDKNDNGIYLYFIDPKQTIWIPKVTVSQEDFKNFEEAAETKLQNVR